MSEDYLTYKGPTPVRVDDKVQVLDPTDQWRDATVSAVFAAQFMAEYTNPASDGREITTFGFYLYKDKGVTWKSN
jgi:hypothetical protein